MSETESAFPFTPKDFEAIRKRVMTLSGIRLGDEKRPLVYGRLSRRLRTLGLPDFASYCALLEEGASEDQPLINAITTNLTSFFREAHHFKLLGDEVRARGKVAAPLRIWSAGCSTGEEPYSIAFTLAQEGARALPILATDIDTLVLEKGRAGIYPLESAEALPRELLQRYFRRGQGAHAGKVQVRPEQRAAIAFRHLNLMESWPMRHKLDVIFCRNVFIYFDRPTQAKLLDRFEAALAPGGLLLLGHSESLQGRAGSLELAGTTAYRKKS